ncbi:MAG: diphthine--ammonia ligase [Candidatus Verstraetearchaeota archaeon]|nr:diphthine--ammonia ligase [Candidatus Verstraetearchaeota archaeon]
MRVAVLFSGGKDSSLCIWRLKSMGHEVACLVSAIPRRDDSYMFHIPNVSLTRVQAGCMCIPWEGIPVSGEKEVEVSELAAAIPALQAQHGFDAMAAGAIASRYQRERIEALCASSGLRAVFPMWQEDEESLLREICALGFEVYFTSVAAEGLGPEWLGRRLDLRAVRDLLRLRERFRINVSGEGGEYETFVSDMPLFQRRINVTTAEFSWVRSSGTMRITGFALEEKRPSSLSSGARESSGGDDKEIPF